MIHLLKDKLNNLTKTSISMIPLKESVPYQYSKASRREKDILSIQTSLQLIPIKELSYMTETYIIKN